MPLKPKKINQSRMFRAVVEQVEEAVLSGELQDGDLLPPETRLAQMFETSRATVREALRVLEEKGLVRVKVGVGGGAFVQHPGPDTLCQGLDLLLRCGAISPDHLAQFRSDVEASAARLAAQRIDHEGRSRLESLLEDAQEALRACHDGQPEAPARFLEKDIALHVALADIAANPMYAAVLRMIHEQILGTRSRTLLRDANLLQQNLDDLRRLAAAVCEGRQEDAATLAREHVGRFCDSLKTPGPDSTTNHAKGD